MQAQPCEIGEIYPIRVHVEFTPFVKTVYTMDVILADVCTAQDQPVEKVISKSRKREYVICRMIFCFVARKKTGKSYRIISETVGGRDHTTAMHSMQTFKDLFETRDPELMANWNNYLANSTLFTQYDFR